MDNAHHPVRLSLDELRTLAIKILQAHGLASDHAEAVAATVVAGERDGCTSHGAYRLIVCARTLQQGNVIKDAVPEVTHPSPALTKVNAHGGFAQLAFSAGVSHLADKVKKFGISALALNNCVHFAALWPEVEAMAERGLVAIACTPSHAWVAPAGGTKPVFGTNPIAFGWPRPGRYPFVFDFATSATARGEIELHNRENKPIPLGWGLDKEGNPTTSAEAALAGAMQTFGGHKGSALAMMIELLGGPLIGDMTSLESIQVDAGRKSSPIGGELIIAIDPEGFLGLSAAAHIARAEKVFDAITRQGARLPSERRYKARARSLSEGVELPCRLYAELIALSHKEE
ncbi:LDH2 family malate/lactate/ureidoglycolate dehydrogenase [Bosea sp. AK1]|uniref:Ldh family oxidoreductase n=1 Tax=Bosea sp. AK1 TaxID=2587160 RepID=UPI0011521523|nr:Ldh family oxidoreductase [Bosea sp. AK1]TQI65277.1 LDH2 family malate/lactate/ureidoglycolate dehydrogenase [Bosea sp. AK1]